MKQNGGNIWVYSEPGKGTAFKIYLPRVFEEAQKVTEERIDEAPAGGTETVLVVEDEEAWEICVGTQGPIHLLLSDVVLPGTSGRESREILGREIPPTI